MSAVLVRSVLVRAMLVRAMLVRAVLVVAVLVVPVLVLPLPAGAAVTATVASQSALRVRTGPAVSYPTTGALAPGSPLTVVCQVTGQRVDGPATRSTDVWDRLPDGTYVSDAWVRGAQGAPECSATSSDGGIASGVVLGGTVETGGTPLRVRTAPDTSAAIAGALADGAVVAFVCQADGVTVAGSVRSTSSWDRLVDGAYVSDAYIRRGTGPGQAVVPSCGAGSPLPVPGPSGALPPGTPILVVTAVGWAYAQLGTPYHFGGDCAAAHSGVPAHECDCSSLVQMAYRAAGVALPRTAAEQSRVGAKVSDPSQLRAGDLLFIPGADGSAAAPGHVGMYVGGGLVLDAPRTGALVQVGPLSAHWLAGLTIRRITAS